MLLGLAGAQIPLLQSRGRFDGDANDSKSGRGMMVTMRDRSKNRKPLQKGRNLSIEAIQAVQALKRAHSVSSPSSPSSDMLERVMESKFRRLLKFDMMAVLRELLRQNECLLALKVFGDLRNECWYKPQPSLYADMISVMGANGLLQEVQLLYSSMRAEKFLEPDVEGFNALLTIFRNFKLAGLLMDCYELMKAVGCEPGRSSFKIVINGLESLGETRLSAMVRQDAHKCYGRSLYFLTEEEEIKQSCS